MKLLKFFLKDITSNPFFKEIDGHEIILFKFKNLFTAYSGICPHLGGPLLGSKVCKNLIVCPWHKYTFDLGENVAYTQEISPWGFKRQKIGLKLKSFKCEQIDDYVLVTVDDD